MKVLMGNTKCIQKQGNVGKNHTQGKKKKTGKTDTSQKHTAQTFGKQTHEQ